MKQTFMLLLAALFFACQNQPNVENQPQTELESTSAVIQNDTLSIVHQPEKSSVKKENALQERERLHSVYGYDMHMKPDFREYGYCNESKILTCYLPEITPLGWSKDGVFAYIIRQPSMEGGTKIHFLDTRNNKILQEVDYHSSLGDFPEKVYKDSVNIALVTLLEDYGTSVGSDDTIHHILSVPSNIVKLNDDIYEFSMETDYIEGERSFGGIAKCKEARLVVDKIDKQSKRSQKKYILGNDDGLDAANGDLYTGKRWYVGYIKDPYSERVVIMYFHQTVGYEGDDFTYVLKLYPFEGF